MASSICTVEHCKVAGATPVLVPALAAGGCLVGLYGSIGMDIIVHRCTMIPACAGLVDPQSMRAVL
jgi:hypothetical protein